MTVRITTTTTGDETGNVLVVVNNVFAKEFRCGKFKSLVQVT
jgi:hypothetical protein